MNTNHLDIDPLITLVLSLSIPEQARICDALLDSLEDPPLDHPDVVAESARTLAAIDEALDELPTNTKLSAFLAHVEAKLAAPVTRGRVAATQRDV